MSELLMPDMHAKPIVGLTTYGRYEKLIESKHYEDHYYVPAVYVDAVRRAGGIPLLIPPGESDWAASLAVIDALVVIGGADVSPEAYDGDAEHAALTRLDAERDGSELALLRYVAHETDLPTLCICRGLQVLNIVLGGTLHEHIPDIVEDDIHRCDQGGWMIQPVYVAPDSRLAQVMQATTVETYSGHHQAIKDLAPGLIVSATAPDGIIEAVEYQNHPWLIAVQWHPEVSAHKDSSQQRLFDALVAEGDARRQMRIQRSEIMVSDKIQMPNEIGRHLLKT